MDSYGSNATPMGGSAGRADAMVGAVESQSKEGVLHIHLFIFRQMATQFNTIHELGEMLRRKMLSVEALKLFIDYVRCASYPDVALHQRHRGDVENSWPAYSADQTLSRLPTFFWTEQAASGALWKRIYQ